ncbi:MAG TPA: hypothetical protein ENJ08_08805 [Gammaproteobacteria bacterium]|nr:hypothetical protein [Gammaproteobacteria bacterium]
MTNKIILKNTPVDGFAVQSIMNFPQNRHHRESWYAIHFANNCLSTATEGDGTKQVEGEILRLLIDAPSLPQMEAHIVESTRKAVVVGDILASLYLMKQFDMPEPSVGKAIQVSRKLAKSTEYGGGSEIAHSERTIKTYIREFETVAHLWAALRINQQFSFETPHESSSEALSSLLEVSAEFLRFGRSFVSHGMKPKVPVLKSQEMWELPEGVAAKELAKDSFPEIMSDLVMGKEDIAAKQFFF